MKNLTKQIYTIYKITNQITEKSYIGFTSENNPIDRFKDHIYSRNLKDKWHYPLYGAMRKYGPDKFIFEILCQSLELNYALNDLEPYFIKQYNTISPNGYNLTNGGEGSFGYKFNQKQLKTLRTARNKSYENIELRNKMRDAHYRVINAPEYKQKLSEWGRKGGSQKKKDTSKMGRYVRTQETKEKLRKYSVRYRYEIVDITTNTKYSYISLRQFSQDLKLNYGSCKNAVRKNKNYKNFKIQRTPLDI